MFSGPVRDMLTISVEYSNTDMIMIPATGD